MIHDTTGYPLYSASLTLGPNETKTAEIDIDCLDDYVLSGTSVTGVTVEARRSGDVSWTNIETSTLSLGTWAGTTQRFEVRFTAGAITAFSRPSFTLSVELGS